MKNRVLIKGGRILDGSPEAVPERRDVLVENGRIAEVVEDINAPDARILDAAGLTVSPGFWDAHAHSDLHVFLDSSAQGRVFDGVTSEVNGTCGFSYFPLTGDAAEEKRTALRKQGVEPDWTDATGYFRAVRDNGSAINRGFLVGAGAIRGAVLGFDPRPPSPDELERMQELLAESLGQGALGLSTGLVYPPGCYAETDEILALCKTLAATGRPHCTHMRSESRDLLDAVQEAVGVCRRSGAPLQISHVKINGRMNWPKIESLEEAIFEAIDEGLDLTADRYPYTAYMTALWALLPPRFMAGGRAKAIERLKDSAERASLVGEMMDLRQGDLPWELIRIGHAEGRLAEFDGLTLDVVANRMRSDPADALCEVLIETRLNCSMVGFEMSEENLERILRWPFVMIGSDSSARALQGPTAVGKPHPRSLCTCARFLGRYVRERKLISLPEAVARLTSIPARRFGFPDRGILAVGAWADIVAFDPETIRDRATYDAPFQLSEGVRHVLVNGTPVLTDGAETGARPGCVLTRTS